MHPLRHTIIDYRPVAWMLVVALLLTMLLPAHYHLHHLHGVDTTEHAHVLDLHVIADDDGHAHHNEHTSIYSATPDAIVKTDKSFVTQFVPIAVFLVLLLVLSDRAWQRPDRSGTPPLRRRFYTSPPLRAPPSR